MGGERLTRAVVAAETGAVIGGALMEAKGMTRLEKTASTVLPPLESSHSTRLTWFTGVGDVVFSASPPGSNGYKIGERSLPKQGRIRTCIYHVLHTKHLPKFEADKGRRDDGPYGRTLSV
jgi:hypothetical protein